jgi:hypothetical protein
VNSPKILSDSIADGEDTMTSIDLNSQKSDEQRTDLHHVPSMVSVSSFTPHVSHVNRRKIAKAILWPGVLVSSTFFVTLSIFPGISSRVTSHVLGDWMAIVMIAVFNIADFFGKGLSGWQARIGFSLNTLLYIAVGRFVFIFLVIACAAPDGDPIIPGEALPLIFMLLLGLTNGYLGSVAMMIGR